MARHGGVAVNLAQVTRVMVIVAAVLAGALMVPAAGSAQSLPGYPLQNVLQEPPNPLNDLFALGQGEGQTPLMLPEQRNAEPPLVATPRAHCLPGSRPEPGIQGRVPASSATGGLRCNVALVSHQGASGGF